MHAGVAPQGTLIDGADLDVAATLVGHGGVADHEVERIGRDQQIAGEDGIFELIGKVEGRVRCQGEKPLLGSRRRLVGETGAAANLRVRRSREGNRAGPRGNDLVGRHFRFAGFQVVDLHEHPRIGGITRLVVEIMLEGEGGQRRIVGKVLAEVLDLQRGAAGGRGKSVFLVRVIARRRPVRLMIDFQPGVACQVIDYLRPTRIVHAFRADPTGDVDRLVLVRAEAWEHHVIVRGHRIRPGHVRVRQRIREIRVFIICHFEFLGGIGEQLAVVDRENRSPGADLRAALIEPRIVV